MKRKYKVSIEGQDGKNDGWRNESGVQVFSNANSPFWVTEGELAILQNNHGDCLIILDEGEYE